MFAAEGLTKRSAVGFLLRSLIMFQTFISRHNSNFFSDKLVLTSVTPASSAPVLQTPKATSSTLYFDSLTVNAGNGGFLHCIQMDTSVNAANQDGRQIAINGHIKFNLTIPLQQLNGLETLVIIMVANKYAFLQITRRRFLNEWEAFK